jgi:hypothetical protein
MKAEGPAAWVNDMLPGSKSFILLKMVLLISIPTKTNKNSGQDSFIILNNIQSKNME